MSRTIHLFDPWPTDQEWVDLTHAADVLVALCDCGVPEGESEATDPRNRNVRLPHHFDCAAVTAWAAIRAAGLRVTPVHVSAPDDSDSTASVG